jgi:hypothetical protein
MIDHHNGNPSDNSIENLREATEETNGYNRKLNTNNTVGYKNISFRKSTGTYRVSILINKKQTEIAQCKSLDDAIRIATEAREKYHGKYARHK